MSIVSVVSKEKKLFIESIVSIVSKKGLNDLDPTDTKNTTDPTDTFDTMDAKNTIDTIDTFQSRMKSCLQSPWSLNSGWSFLSRRYEPATR